MMEAIVLDGEQRSALAVTRSLGRKGIRVTVGSERKASLSSCSRYCANTFLYPSPYVDPAGFMNTLLDYAKTCRPSLLLPMTDVTLTEIMSRRVDFPENVSIPFMEYDKYLQVTDKLNLFRLARDLDIPIPASLFSTEFDHHENMLEEVSLIGYPVVVKSGFSKIHTGTGWINAKVCYATDENELRKILSIDVFRKFPFLIQKKIEGPGVGIFLLLRNGDVVARFAHRRIREKPPSGGVSVLSESIEPPPDAMQSAVKILQKVRWTGVAMVEFKIDREQNIAKLLEVNARFWGSLQLAIASGVDFPYLLFCLSSGENNVYPNRYTIGLKSRWELGDLDHLLLRLLKDPLELNLNAYCNTKYVVIREFIYDFFRNSVKNEILQKDDMKPFLCEAKDYVKHIFLHH